MNAHIYTYIDFEYIRHHRQGNDKSTEGHAAPHAGIILSIHSELCQMQGQGHPVLVGAVSHFSHGD